MTDSPTWMAEIFQKSQLPEKPDTIDAIYKTFEATHRLTVKVLDAQEKTVSVTNELEKKVKALNELEKKIAKLKDRVADLEEKMSRVRRRRRVKVRRCKKRSATRTTTSGSK